MLLAMVKVNIRHGGLCSKSKALGVTLKDPGTCLGPKGVSLKWANTWTRAGGSVCKKNSNVTINNIPHSSPLNSCQQAHALVYDWKSVMNNTGCITEPRTRKFAQLLFPCSLSFEWQEKNNLVASIHPYIWVEETLRKRWNLMAYSELQFILTIQTRILRKTVSQRFGSSWPRRIGKCRSFWYNKPVHVDEGERNCLKG